MDKMDKMKSLLSEIEKAEDKINNLKLSVQHVDDVLSGCLDKSGIDEYFTLELKIIEELKKELILCLKDDEPIREEPPITVTTNSYILPTKIIKCKCGVNIQKRRMSEHVKTPRHKIRLKQYNLSLYNKKT